MGLDFCQILCSLAQEFCLTAFNKGSRFLRKSEIRGQLSGRGPISLWSNKYVKKGFPLRYQATFSAFVMGLLTLCCANVSSQSVPLTRCEVIPDLLGPGSYEIVLVATGGSKAGRSTTGKLVLRASAPGDVSPRTGEAVSESEHHRLYGSMEFGFDDVGAPIRVNDPVAPAPDSTDPVYPGVLVHEDSNRFGLLLTVGTLSNLRNDLRTGMVWVDGPGIALFVTCLTPTEFSGTWTNWGILENGTGYFYARRKNVE
jgi:hypothetical protein